jgi:hypothetical protein
MLAHVSSKVDFCTRESNVSNPPVSLLNVFVSMGESRGAYTALVGKPEGRRPLGRPRRRWEDNIKMNLREVELGAQDRDRWRAFVYTVINLRVP